MKDTIDSVGTWVLIVGILALVVFQGKLGVAVPKEIAGLPIFLIGRKQGKWEGKRA